MGSKPNGEPPGLTFPCQIDIKVFMHAKQDNANFVENLLLQVIDENDFLGVSVKQSKNGKYNSVSCKVNAQTKYQMDTLYKALSSTPRILMVI